MVEEVVEAMEQIACDYACKLPAPHDEYQLDCFAGQNYYTVEDL
jgi:hypothetical protein